jgi:hypothetical protein
MLLQSDGLDKNWLDPTGASFDDGEDYHAVTVRMRDILSSRAHLEAVRNFDSTSVGMRVHQVCRYCALV